MVDRFPASTPIPIQTPDLLLQQSGIIMSPKRIKYVRSVAFRNEATDEALHLIHFHSFVLVDFGQ